MGVLGTVLGMIQTVLVIQQKAPLVQVGDLAAGLWQALLTTAAGLVVAMFSYIGYNLLVSKVDVIALDMEWAAGEILAFFASQNMSSITEPPAGAGSRGPDLHESRDAVAAGGIHALTGAATRNRNSYTSRTDI